MAINLDCPRCKAHLRVPNKKADGYVNCPHCQGRFWVDRAAPSDATPADTVTTAVPPVVLPPAPPPYVATDGPSSLGIPMRSSPAALKRDAISPGALPATPATPAPPPSLALPPMRSPSPVQAVVPPAPPGNPAKPNAATGPANDVPPIVSPGSPLAPPVAPPVVSRPGRKVARFISAESAQSSLQPAADGKLPELHLVDGDRKDEQAKKSSSLSPLALVGIISFSVLLSVMILVFGNTSPATNADARAKAWKEIEANYFVNPGGNELKPYNLLLREARRAHQSQDHKSERELFDKVLDLLRAERDVGEKGLTGSRERDKKLQEHIMVLMSGLK
jgi:hypothetical protein